MTQSPYELSTQYFNMLEKWRPVTR